MTKTIQSKMEAKTARIATKITIVAIPTKAVLRATTKEAALNLKAITLIYQEEASYHKLNQESNMKKTLQMSRMISFSHNKSIKKERNPSVHANPNLYLKETALSILEQSR